VGTWRSDEQDLPDGIYEYYALNLFNEFNTLHQSQIPLFHVISSQNSKQTTNQQTIFGQNWGN
jgi:hypothetical protein